MYKSNDEKYAALYRQRILDSARRDYERAKQKRTMAAVTDFATSLLSIMGRNKGVQYDVAPRPQAATAARGFEIAKQRYFKAITDYGGRIAADSFKTNGAKSGNNLPLVPVARNSVRHSALSPAMEWKYGSKGRGDILHKIKNIKTPVWYINNNKK